MDRKMSQDLDRYITGNYGEKQLSDECGCGDHCHNSCKCPCHLEAPEPVPVNPAETEEQFIKRQQAKLDANLRRQLRLVVSDPFALGRRTIETLLVNGLIEFGGPSETCQYNHHRLTELGKETLTKLDAPKPRILTAEDIERIGKHATRNGSNINYPQRY